MRSIVLLAFLLMSVGCGQKDTTKPTVVNPLPTATNETSPTPERVESTRPSAVSAPVASPAPVPNTPPAPITPPPAPKTSEIPMLQPSKSYKLDIFGTTSISVSPDATVFGVSGYKDREQKAAWCGFYYDANTGKEFGKTPDLLGPGQLTTDGKTAAFMDVNFDKDSDIIIYNIVAKKSEKTANVKNGLEPYRFAPNGKLIVTGRINKVGFFAVPGGKPAFPEVIADKPILEMSNIYLAGTRVATLHEDGIVLVWDLTTGKQLDKVDLGRKKASSESILISEDGSTAVLKNEKGENVVWDWKTKKLLKWEKPGYYSNLSPISEKLVYYTDSTYSAATSAFLKCIVVAEAQTGKIVERLMLPDDDKIIYVYPHHSRDGKRFVALTPDTQTVYVWDRLVSK